MGRAVADEQQRDVVDAGAEVEQARAAARGQRSAGPVSSAATSASLASSSSGSVASTSTSTKIAPSRIATS